MYGRLCLACYHLKLDAVHTVNKRMGLIVLLYKLQSRLSLMAVDVPILTKTSCLSCLNLNFPLAEGAVLLSDDFVTNCNRK